MIEELNVMELELNKIKGILYNEGEYKFEKTLLILNGFIKFIEELKVIYEDIEDGSDDEYVINNILRNINEAIKLLKENIGI